MIVYIEIPVDVTLAEEDWAFDEAGAMDYIRSHVEGMLPELERRLREEMTRQNDFDRATSAEERPWSF